MHEMMDQLDFWRTGPVGEPSQVMIPATDVEYVKQALEAVQLEFEVHINNVQSLIDEETKAIMSREKATTLATFDYNKYHSYQEIMDWVTNFRKDESSSALVIEEINVATSYEGRQIKALRLTTGSGRLGAYTQGGIHAREWVSPATVINLLKKFVDAFKAGDSVATEFFSKFDWYVIPSLNVDGYHHTRPEASNTDRMWRKNRQPTYTPSCTGVDMNRNYGYKWGGSGSSGYPCSEAYRGGSAFDAVELKQVTDWLLGLKNGGQQFMIHVDVHSYSQYWVYPYSYTYSSTAKVPDLADLERVAHASVAKLTAVHGKSYSVMTSGDWYPAAGASEDFGYMTLGAKYSYTVEMRDTGYYGFELPENQIQPCGEETYAGFREMFRQVLLEV
ncbi:carboxypeptidase B-like [Patiria miniata]|uniref:Peptidase M14 domain-containing protein n=1 Tax=Patiria miniata TaxID=46514 RepID=A0A914BBQ1_PATMI|nr:carboxypeptidase B-like [Patiria miniata]